MLLHVLQVKWVNWMANTAMPDIPSEMNFSDIIVPTMDLVRGSFVLEMLLTNNKKVRLTVSLLKKVKRYIACRTGEQRRARSASRTWGEEREKIKFFALLSSRATRTSRSPLSKIRKKFRLVYRVKKSYIEWRLASNFIFGAQQIKLEQKDSYVCSCWRRTTTKYSQSKSNTTESVLYVNRNRDKLRPDGPQLALMQTLPYLPIDLCLTELLFLSRWCVWVQQVLVKPCV